MKIGFLGLLGLVFIVLKLTHTIDWSWWWVTSPLWGGFVIAIAIIIVLRFLVVPLLDVYSRIFHKEQYKYMKKLNKRMDPNTKVNLQEKLRLLKEEQEKLKEERENRKL